MTYIVTRFLLCCIFKKLFILHWGIADNHVVIVSAEQQRNSAIRIHVSIVPQTLLPSWLLHNSKQSSIRYTIVSEQDFFLDPPPRMTKIKTKIKLEIELPYDPAIPLLGIHTEETRSERDTCTPMSIAALFMIARTWKQPRCPSADKWIRKMWCTYTMEYYSAIKKNSFESVLIRWMKLEPIIQSEVSQKENHKYSILTRIYGI